MKKVFLTITAITLGMFVLTSYGMRIAVVDFTTVLKNDPAVKQMQKQLRKKFNPQGKQLLKARDHLRADVVKFRSAPVRKV